MFKRKTLMLLFFLISSFSFAFTIKNGYISDDYGNKVEAKEYKKMIITDPSIIEILFEIKGNKNISAISKTKRSKINPVEEIEKLDSIGGIININYEKILQYKPDLVVINSMMLRNMGRLKAMGYKVIVSKSEKLEDVIKLIEVAGILSNQKENSEKLKKESLKKLEKIKKVDRELKGVILYATTPMISFPEDSLPGDVLKALGVKNLASNVKGSRPIMSPEYILKENPDFIAGAMSLSNPEQIKNASVLISKTKAGKNNNIFILDSSIILRGSHRIFDEILKLKKELEKISNN